MTPSEYLYGKHYDKEFVQSHISLFYRQILWAEETVEELLKKPLTVDYFCFECMCFKPFPVRDLRRINDCLNAIKWNRSKINEANERNY